MITDLALYIHSHYGACAMNQKGEACACLLGKRFAQQAQCPDWQPTTATTWEELLAQAKERYNKHKE